MTIRIALCCALVSLATVELAPSSAQQLTLIPETRISGKAQGFNPMEPVPFTVGPNGPISWGSRREIPVRLITEAGTKIKELSLPPEWDKNHAIYGPMGWFGDSIWVVWGPRIGVFSKDGVFGRAFSLGMTVHGPPGTLPVVHPEGFLQQVLPKALYPGGDLLLLEYYSRTLPRDTTTLLLRVSATGEYRNTMGSVTSDRTACSGKITLSDGSTVAGDAAFCDYPQTSIAPNGSLAVTLVRKKDRDDSTRFDVVRINSKGDTASVIEYGYPSRRTTKMDSDSFWNDRTKSAMTIPNERNRLAAIEAIGIKRKLPLVESRPPLNVIAGNDGSIWVEVPRAGAGHHWMVIDSSQKVLGVVTVPAKVRLTEVSRSGAWGREQVGDGVQDLVKFRIEVPTGKKVSTHEE